MTNILLTGGTGFFGKALLRHWIESERNGQHIPRVTILSRSPTEFQKIHPEFSPHRWLRFHQGDILKPDTLPITGSFSHILHAATDSTYGPQMAPLERFRQILDGTRNMLDYAVGRGISRFLFTSSGGVYGPQPPDSSHLIETYTGMPDPLDPKNAYSVAKRCAEHLCLLYQDSYSIDIIIARCFAFVGQDLPCNVHFAIGNFIRDALQSPEIEIKGNGTPIRSYMDQRDLANWLITLLEKGRAGSAYNVGSDNPIAIRDLAEKIRDLLAPGKKIVFHNLHGGQDGRDRYVPSTLKAKTELGLSTTYTLDQAILHAAHFIEPKGERD